MNTQQKEKTDRTEATTFGIKQKDSSKKSKQTNSAWNSENTNGNLKVHYNNSYPIAILEDGDEWWPIIGNQKVSKTPFKSMAEVEKRIQKTDWEFIGAVVITLAQNIATQKFYELKNLEK